MREIGGEIGYFDAERPSAGSLARFVMSGEDTEETTYIGARRPT
jgi:hypothetical protein